MECGQRKQEGEGREGKRGEDKQGREKIATGKSQNQAAVQYVSQVDGTAQQ